MVVYVDHFVRLAEAQAGDAYVWGTEASPSDPDPDAFDCSELVQWCLFRLGIPWVDGSWIQEQACKNAGTMTSVEIAIRTRGALMFIAANGRVHHVAISRGDGTTIEARGRAFGTNIFSAFHRFTSAGLIPGLAYAPAPIHSQPRRLLEEEYMPTFCVDPHDPSPAVGRTRGYRLVKPLRTVLAVNGAPLCERKHDGTGRAVIPPIPAKYGEIIDMDVNANQTGLVVLLADDGTLDLPFRGPLPRL